MVFISVEMVMITRITLNLRLVVYGGPNVEECTHNGIPLTALHFQNTYPSGRPIEVRTTVDIDVSSSI